MKFFTDKTQSYEKSFGFQVGLWVFWVCLALMSWSYGFYQSRKTSWSSLQLEDSQKHTEIHSSPKE
jgi:hypothetical protein